MTRFQQEIEQIPAAIELLVSYYQREGRERLLAFRSRAAGRRCIIFSGMGTSRFAPEAAFPRMARLGVSCTSVDTGEWLHYDICIPGAEDLVVLTSQSGESAEVKALVADKKARSGLVAITNDESSTLARHAGLVLPLLAGEEMSISTKTYANTLALVHLLAAVMEGEAALSEGIDELHRAADALHDSDDKGIVAGAEVLAGAAAIAFIGRGPAYVAARQCALTFMEGTRCPAVAFSGGAFNHGPAEILQSGSRIIVFRPDGRCSRLMESLAERAAVNGADVLLIGGTHARAIEGVRSLGVPSIEAAEAETLFPLLACRTQNLLLHSVAAGRGHEAGVFRYGGKVTSHE